MAITQNLTFETDDLSEFLTMVKAYLPIVFSPGVNENEEYHNMYYDKSESPRYWLLNNYDDKPIRKSVIALSHHLSKPNSKTEVKVKMDFEKYNDKLYWTASSYGLLIDEIITAIKENINPRDKDDFWSGETVKGLDVNGWIKDESDISGSSTISYKMEFKEQTPGCLYISLGYEYLSQ